MRVAGVLLILLFVCGCSTIKKQVDFYNACLNDNDCKARMELIGHQVAYAVAPEGTSNKIQDVLGILAGMLGTGLAGMIYGRKLCDQKKVV